MNGPVLAKPSPTVLKTLAKFERAKGEVRLNTLRFVDGQIGFGLLVWDATGRPTARGVYFRFNELKTLRDALNRIDWGNPGRRP